VLINGFSDTCRCARGHELADADGSSDGSKGREKESSDRRHCDYIMITNVWFSWLDVDVSLMGV